MATPIVRFTAGSLLAGLLLAAGCAREAPAPSPQNVAREKLRQVVSLWVSDEPLADALTRIGREYGLVIEIDELVRKGTGTNPADRLAQPVSLQVRNIQLGSALHHLLRPLDLTYDLNGPAIHVTTPARLPKLAVGRVHPVADLLGHEVDLDEDGLAELLCGVFPSQPFTLGWNVPRIPAPPDDIVDRPGVLVVSRPLLTHDRIALLLEDMRQLADPLRSPPQRKLTAAEAAIVAALDTPISVDYLEKPLADIRRELADQHGINILFDRAAVLDAGIVPEETFAAFRVRPKQLPLRDVLRLILAAWGLGFTVQQECLLITSKDELEQLLEVRLYSTRGLLEPQRAVTTQSVAEAVMSSVEPDTWQDAGGTALLRAVRGGLVAHAHWDAHRQITAFLDQLRRATDPAIVGYTPLPKIPDAAWIEAKLAEPTDLLFDKTPFSDVAEYFSQRHDVPILLHRPPIEADRILFNRWAVEEDRDIVPENVVITRQLNGVSLRAGLQAVLDEVGFDFIIDRSQRALIITSRYDAELRPTTRFYRVGGLVGVVPPGKLMELVQDIVMPDSWGNAGGPASLEMLGNVFMVSQDHRGHQQVRQFLDALRRHVVPPPLKDLLIAEWPENQAAKRIERKLDEPTAFAFRHMTLKQVMDRLSKQHDLPILFHRRSLEDAGIVPEHTWITPSLKRNFASFSLVACLG